MSEQAVDTLKRVKAWFEQGVGSAAYAAWRAEAKTCWDFYDGSQWAADEVARLEEVGQPAIVINRIAAKIDNLAGSEVAGRTRIVYRSRSGNAEEEATASALTDLALYVAERGEQALEISAAFKAGMVAGIGWLDVGVEERVEGPNVFCRAEDELAVVWDPLSRRGDFSDARFVARERWLGEEELASLFPDKAGAVRESLRGVQAGGMPYGGLVPGKGDVLYWDSVRDVYRVVEVQYKMPAKQWRLRLPDGTLVSTFDGGLKKKVSGAVVEDVSTVSRVHVAYFAGDVLLDDRPLAYEHNAFTLVPYCYKRHRADGRPYGLVRAALDPQRELNKRRSKAMHLLNTAQVIADIDAVEDPAILAREAARPDGIILKRGGKDLRIVRNTDLAASQVDVMQQAGRDIQEVIGVFDESIGKQSNAASGVAIQQRQLAGSLNQMFAFDALRLCKKLVGGQVLALIRQFFSHEMVIRVTDQLGAARTVKLNSVLLDGKGQPLTDAQGRELKVLDVRAGAFDVVVEEVRDVVSSRELELQRLQLLLAAGVQIPPALLVEASGVRGKEQILSAMQGQQGVK